ncbi:intelectin-like protein-like [Platysternon megacephalum]|uniref:Intelectin-like protein-like n=1 Tax=Platysternon megacephalum TaxID=55544 RepID=A0A4D9DXP1_9SAUR|nr:intelectin-like protein-like [Platysternon megacephalum]
MTRSSHSLLQVLLCLTVPGGEGLGGEDIEPTALSETQAEHLALTTMPHPDPWSWGQARYCPCSQAQRPGSEASGCQGREAGPEMRASAEPGVILNSHCSLGGVA